MAKAKWQIEPFDNSRHDRGEFCSGKAPLDTFLHQLVSRYEKRRIGRTHVAVRAGERRVYGYHTLASGAIPFASLPKGKLTKKLPNHPVPAVLLGRLAVDQSTQGQGLGRDLLVHALQQSVRVSEKLGVFAVVVDALDEEAKQFYEHFGFTPLLNQPMCLFLPISTIVSSLSGEEEGDEGAG